eukprot:856975-Pyramimonas_sp.AAC.1
MTDVSTTPSLSPRPNNIHVTHMRDEKDEAPPNSATRPKKRSPRREKRDDMLPLYEVDEPCVCRGYQNVEPKSTCSRVLSILGFILLVGGMCLTVCCNVLIVRTPRILPDMSYHHDYHDNHDYMVGADDEGIIGGGPVHVALHVREDKYSSTNRTGVVDVAGDEETELVTVQGTDARDASILSSNSTSNTPVSDSSTPTGAADDEDIGVESEASKIQRRVVEAAAKEAAARSGMHNTSAQSQLFWRHFAFRLIGCARRHSARFPNPRPLL